MKILLLVSGVIAVLIGVALLFASGSFMAPMGIAVDAKIATIAQAQGALLVALGATNLLARGLDARAARPVLAGNLVAQALSLAVNLRAGMMHLVTPNVWGAVVMHVVLGALFAWFLFRPAAKAAAA